MRTFGRMRLGEPYRFQSFETAMRSAMKTMKTMIGMTTMKRWLLGLGALCGLQTLSAQNLDSLLRTVHDRDQAVRLEVLRLSQQEPQQVDSLLAACARMEEVDARNRQIVSSLLENGWPEGLSDEANETIWLVIDHADLAMQRRFMLLVEEQMRAGRISGASYATLLDRMLMREGRPQRYGTQTHASTLLVDGAPQRVERICRLWPVESPERLDSLREAVGLEPIDDYLRAVGESYGAPCTWDPTLGVEAFSEE